MPPPPPPSASYLLKFDSSSDEEEYDYVPQAFRRQEPPLNASPSYPSSSISNSTSKSTVTLSSKSSKVLKSTYTSSIDSSIDVPASNNSANEISAATTRKIEDNIDHSDGGDDKNDDHDKKKKKKKRRKKKKNKRGNGTADETQSDNATQSLSSAAARKNRKTVSFRSVNVSEFYREMGGGGIPSDGGWPLALSDKKFREYAIPIDEFEARKQVELRDRYKKFVTVRRRNHRKTGNDNSSGHHHHGRKRSNSKHGDEMKSQRSTSKHEDEPQDKVPVFIPETVSFETRQYDYKPRGEDVHSEGGKNSEIEWNEIKITGRNHLFSQLHESERKQILLRDADIKEGDIVLNPDVEKDNHASGSNGHRTSPSRSKRKESISESNEAFCSLEVKHIRNELEQIRIQRTAEDSRGCSCRKLYVPVGKGSRHHRRLTERRVKDELRKRHVTVPNPATRDELEQLLHDIVERQGCCYGKDCICYRNGLGCQGDTCSCWHLSHTGHAKKEKDFSVSGEEAKTICGNQNGIYLVDFTAIDSYRRKFIPGSQGVCTPASN